MIAFACEEYGWSWEYVCEGVSLLSLMLLMRQKVHSSSNGKGDGFTLLQQEEMDENANVPWEELVRRNRERLAKTMAAYN